MARASVTEENQALSTTGWSFVSVHTADPGTTGASEASGTGYSRGAVTWGSASGGSVSNSAAVSVGLPASTTVTHFGVWSASSAGTYYIGGALSSSITTGTSTGTASIAIGGLTVSAS